MTFSILRRHRPLYAPVTGGGGGIMQYLTGAGATAVVQRDGTLVVERDSTQVVDQRP